MQFNSLPSRPYVILFDQIIFFLLNKFFSISHEETILQVNSNLYDHGEALLE